MRTELEVCPTQSTRFYRVLIWVQTRLVHLRPAELLIPERGISEPTTKLLHYFIGYSGIFHVLSMHAHCAIRDSATGDKLRIEYIKELMSYTDAFSSVSKFYTDKKRAAAASDEFRSGMCIKSLRDFNFPY